MRHRQGRQGADRRDRHREHDDERQAIAVVERDHQADRRGRARGSSPTDMPRTVSERFCCWPPTFARTATLAGRSRPARRRMKGALHERLRRARREIRLHVHDRLAIDARHQRFGRIANELRDVADVGERAVVAAQRNLADRAKRRLERARVDHLHVLRAARRCRTASRAFHRRPRESRRRPARCSRSSRARDRDRNATSICGASRSADVLTLSVPGVWRSTSATRSAYLSGLSFVAVTR